jgi:2-dehydro-3-deoxyglucarate aldolase/4-hydroxy-2-oxoheptanedioate aldolase
LERVVRACRDHQLTAGYMVVDAANGRAMLERGFRILAYSGDLWLYQAVLRDGIGALRKLGDAVHSA